MTQKLKNTILNIVFFGITTLLIVAEYNQAKDVILLAKPLLIPSLAIIYLVNAKKISKWYLVALIFAFASNLFFLFSTPQLLFYGIVAFLFYRISSIIVVIRNGDQVFLLPILLASIPFLIVFSYLLYIMVSPDNPSFYATIINDLIISIFSGIGLSSYFMNDNEQNSWLFISTLLFSFLVILFMFDNFYLSYRIFKPLSALVFSLAHYTFFKFMQATER